MSPNSQIRDWYLAGRITLEQASCLMQLVQEIAWRRLPWWKRLTLRLTCGSVKW